MTTAVQRRRGTNTEHATFTGLDGEITVNTTTYTLHVHDGATVGGIVLAKADGSNIVTSSIDINGGTIDGTIIGGSSAAAGSFTTVTASSSATIASNLFFNSTSGAMRFGTDAGTEKATIRLSGNDLKFENSSGLQRLLVKDAGGLDVTGTVTADGLTVTTGSASGTLATLKGSTGFGFTLASSGVSPYVQEIGVGGGEEIALTSGGVTLARFQDGGDISFYEDTGTTAKFFWDASAESLGIGTASPISIAGYTSLTLSNTTGSFAEYQENGVGRLRIGGDNGTGFINGSAGTLRLLTSDVERMRIDSAGNVGIGVSSPSNRLDVWDTSGGVIGSFTNGANADFNIDCTSGVTLLTPTTGVLALGTSSTERMRIDSSGNLLLGGTSTAPLDGISGMVIGNTTTATNAGLALARTGKEYLIYTSPGDTGLTFWDSSTNTVQGSFDATNGYFWSGSSTGSDFTRLAKGNGMLVSNGQVGDTGVSYWATSARGADTGRQFLYFQYSNTSLAFQVFNNGDTQNLNNSYGALSDRKLKENIAPASSQWDDIKAVEVCSYNLKSTGEKHIGVIAQQLEEVGQNGLVSEFTERDENGELTEETTKTVKYSVLYMKAIKALQEAMTRIETLEAEVAALKGA